jgi:hypothetical protein
MSRHRNSFLPPGRRGYFLPTSFVTRLTLTGWNYKISFGRAYLSWMVDAHYAFDPTKLLSSRVQAIRHLKGIGVYKQQPPSLPYFQERSGP